MSSEEVDPSLNSGWVYFVKEDAYKTYLTCHAKEPQEVSYISTFMFPHLLLIQFKQRSICVSHSTVNSADTKPSCGLVAMGIGTIDCA